MSITRRTFVAFLCFGLILCAPPLSQSPVAACVGRRGDRDARSANGRPTIRSHLLPGREEQWCGINAADLGTAGASPGEQDLPAQIAISHGGRVGGELVAAARPTRHPEDTPLLHAHTEAFAVWTGQSLMRNAPPGGYDTRLASWHAEEEGPLTLDYLCLSGEFASLHALRTGSYTLVLPPGRTKVLDADSREVLSAGAQSYTFPVVAQQTYWLLFQ